MSAALAGFGMRPIYDQSGRVRARCFQNGILSGYATAIYQYSPVLWVTSTYNTLNIAAVGATEIGGVFDGVEYTDSNGRRQYSKYWPAGLVPLAGTTWNVYVWDDPRTIFEIQANGALGEVAGRGMAGQQLDLAASPGSGSAVTQLSSATADASSISATAQKQLRIVDKARYVDNDWGDAYPILQVMIARSQYIAPHVAV